MMRELVLICTIALAAGCGGGADDSPEGMPRDIQPDPLFDPAGAPPPATKDANSATPKE